MSVSVTVEFGVAVPMILTLVTPTIGLLGDNVPVRFDGAELTVKLTFFCLVRPPPRPSSVIVRVPTWVELLVTIFSVAKAPGEVGGGVTTCGVQPVPCGT